MELQQDLISVVIPAFNAADHIDACLASVATQVGDFRLEILVVDDGSTDATTVRRPWRTPTLLGLERLPVATRCELITPRARWSTAASAKAGVAPRTGASRDGDTAGDPATAFSARQAARRNSWRPGSWR